MLGRMNRPSVSKIGMKNSFSNFLHCFSGKASIKETFLVESWENESLTVLKRNCAP